VMVYHDWSLLGMVWHEHIDRYGLFLFLASGTGTCVMI